MSNKEADFNRATQTCNKEADFNGATQTCSTKKPILIGQHKHHTPNNAFRHLPPKGGCRKPVLGVCTNTCNKEADFTRATQTCATKKPILTGQHKRVRIFRAAPFTQAIDWKTVNTKICLLVLFRLLVLECLEVLKNASIRCLVFSY